MIRVSRGSGPWGPGPRFFAAPTNSPRSRAARHAVRCEEYRPSRRSNAPLAPGVLQPSASRTTFRLYSTVNRRRLAFATTSTSGPARAISVVLIGLRSLLALDTKLPGGHCLTHIGREGRAIVRVLQCVAAGGVVCNVASTTARIFCTDTRGVRPGRGASCSSPATRRARNRSRHSCTVGRETFRARAMSWLGTRSAAIVMIFARTTFRCERLRPRVQVPKVARSSGANTMGAAVLLMLDSIATAW